MNGYIKVNISGNGVSMICYQKIVDGIVVDYVDGSGNSTPVPSVRDETVMDSTLLANPS